jgi:hypothetical protein
MLKREYRRASAVIQDLSFTTKWLIDSHHAAARIQPSGWGSIIRRCGQKITGRDTRASISSRFLRPFNGCVPQPEKKRRLFDSHNPNSLMVAELRATISKVPGRENQGHWKSKEKYPRRRRPNFGFYCRVSTVLLVV